MVTVDSDTKTASLYEGRFEDRVQQEGELGQGWLTPNVRGVNEKENKKIK